MRIAIAAASLLFVAVAMPAQAKPSCGLDSGQPATGEPIQVGAVTSASGLFNFSSGSKAAAAYFKCVNANGGIHGRPIAYTVGDDQSRADVAAQVAQKLVNDVKVVALAGGASGIECLPNAALYQSAGLYDILSTGPTAQCYMSSNIVPLSAGPRLSVIADARYAVEQLGAKSVACSRPNIPGTEWICNGVKEWGAKRGVKVSEVVFDPASVDYNSLVLQAAATKADAFVPLGTYDSFVQLAAAAEGQDLAAHMKVAAPGSAYHPNLPKAIGDYWNNRFWVSLEYKPTDAAGPDNTNWHEVMATYGEKGDPQDNFSQGGYLAARLLAESLLKLDPEKIDRATVTAALAQVTDFSSDMLCGPISFGGASATRHNPNHGNLMAVVTDGKWKVVSDCMESDDPELAAAAQSK